MQSSLNSEKEWQRSSTGDSNRIIKHTTRNCPYNFILNKKKLYWAPLTYQRSRDHRNLGLSSCSQGAEDVRTRNRNRYNNIAKKESLPVTLAKELTKNATIGLPRPCMSRISAEERDREPHTHQPTHRGNNSENPGEKSSKGCTEVETR